MSTQKLDRFQVLQLRFMALQLELLSGLYISRDPAFQKRGPSQGLLTNCLNTVTELSNAADAGEV